MNREDLEMALKLYEERQSSDSGSTTQAATVVGTPSLSPTTASTSAKPRAKKRSKDTATAEDDELKQMLKDAKFSEDAAERLLNRRTKKRKEVQKQVKDIKQEVANAKKILEEAQQRLADKSKDLATAKSKEDTQRRHLSMAKKTREDIEGEIKPTMEPKSLFKEDDVVSANFKGGEEDNDDDDKKTKGEETDDEDKNMAAVVTPPKKKRKKKMTKIVQLSNEEKEIIEKKINDSSTYLIKFEEYLNNVDAAGELSKQNKRSVLRQVNKLVGGEGIRYDSKTEDCWPQGCYFLKGVKVGPTDDISTLMDDAKACEEQWGRDRGNGWLLRHPLGKMAAFQQYLLQD